MFETSKIQAFVHKVQYDGKQDSADGSDGKGEGTRKDAIVSVTFKTQLSGSFMEEVERKYFPGVSGRASLSKDKTRYYKDSCKLRVPEQTLEIHNEVTGEVLLNVFGVDLNPPITLICKDGIADLYVRVHFRWLESLNILKSLDQSAVVYSLFRTQAEFDGVLAAATQFDAEDEDPIFEEEPDLKFKVSAGVIQYIEKEVLADGETVQDCLKQVGKTFVDNGTYRSLEQFAQEHEIVVSDVDSVFFEGPDPFDEDHPSQITGKSGKSKSKQSKADDSWNPYQASNQSGNAKNNSLPEAKNSIPPLSKVASEKPVSLDQVDYRLCNVASKKAELELAELDEALEYTVGQEAAKLAFKRGKGGVKVKITIADLEEAKKMVFVEE